ncbi:sensor histidine kinase [Flavobacterium qiangtangense]|uniref:Sensor histidine kinase n=1 Tax=Flavobacterium qiangtangense TaxID=1442595 RepID=A0ABW1PMY3_9FLAO
MKAFKKLALLSALPTLFIGITSLIIAGSFADFSVKIVSLTIGFFVLIALNYVYIFEKIQAKENKIVKSISMTALSTFISISLFGILIQIIFLNEFLIQTPLFQGLLGIVILILEFGFVSIYRNRNSKNVLDFKEKPLFYLVIILTVSSIETFFLSLFSVELINLVDFTQFCFDNFFIPTLQVTSVSMLCLYILSQIKFTKRNIFISIVVASIVAYLTIYAIGSAEFRRHIVIIRFFTIGLSSTILCATIILYRNRQKESIRKINALSISNSRKDFEYLQLKNQVNPHFLFNNLNTLISFIEIEPKKAIEFGHHLSNVYRHYLKNETEDFVLLSVELQFIKDYLEIYKAKFESGFSFEIKNDATQNLYILSFSLQEIIDNIFKHNILDEEKPIEIRIASEENYLKITNSLNPQDKVISTNKGLQNINNRNKILINKEIIISKTESSFEIKIPTLKLEN